MKFSAAIKLSVFIFLTYALTCHANPQHSLVTNSNNNFAFKLMRESLKIEATPKNRFLSPISAHMALSMILNGTNGETRLNLLQQLGYPINTSNEQINIQNRGLLNQLIKPPITAEEKQRLISNKKGLPVVFTIQNSAWTSENYNFNQSYTKILTDFYQVPRVTSLNFADPKSADTINEWVKKSTQGMVPKIISTDELSSFIWILLNTTYLEAQWEYPFKIETNRKPFHLSSSDSVTTPFISRISDSRLASIEQANIAELTFNKSSIKAYVVLPHTMDDFTKLMDADSGVWTETFWENVFGKLQDNYIDLRMPKFSFKDGVLLKKAEALTKALGINFLFENTANLSGMDSNMSSALSLIKQNTKIEWDEKGVKAAAATLVAGERTSVPPEPTSFIVDRPFYFAIYDESNQTFLFLGQVVDPRKTE